MAIVIETHLLHSTFTHFNNALMHAINFTVRKLKMNVIQFWLASLLNQGFYKSGLYAAKFDTTQCTQATHRLKSWSIVSTNLAKVTKSLVLRCNILAAMITKLPTIFHVLP